MHTKRGIPILGERDYYMRIYKRGRVWYLDYEYRGRRIRKRVGRSKKVAELALKDIEVRIAKGESLGIRESKRVLFRDFAEEYLEYSRANKAPRSYERDCTSLRPNLIPPFGDCYLTEISSVMVEKYKSWRLQKVKPATVNRELTCLRHPFRKAVEWGYASSTPLTGVRRLKEPPGRVRYLEQDEIDRLLAQCAPHVRSVVLVALHTGLRKSELLGLMWRDVNMRQRAITVSNSRNNESRTIPINSVLREELKRIPRHLHSDYVFCDSEGRPYGDVKKGFRAAVRRTGIQDFRFHDLRHTFASQLVMAGADIRTVQELLGHKEIKMAMRYSHLSKKHLEGAVESLAQRLRASQHDRRLDASVDT